VFDCWKRSAGAGVPGASPHCPACGAAAPGESHPLLRKIGEDDFAPVVAGLTKLTEELVPRLEALQKRVDDIARTPLPPQTAGRGLTLAAIAKSDDGGGAAPQDIVAALARMTEEERTLILIKAAQANPIAPFARR
jgi:hypothetical protein